MRWKNVSPKGKLSCLEEAKLLPGNQFMLLIDNTVIIEDKSMIAKMIAKNLDFVSPMMRTGNDAQIQRLCYHGWNTTESSQISFPSTPNNRTKVHMYFQITFCLLKKYLFPFLFQRGLNFVLFETLASGNSTDTKDTINFWTPYNTESLKFG